VRIYIAGPLGFSEAGRSFYYEKLIPLVRELGHEALDPWALTGSIKIEKVMKLPYGPTRRDAWQQLNVEIGRNNQAAIDICERSMKYSPCPNDSSRFSERWRSQRERRAVHALFRCGG
jgi:hypothetical protein